MMTQNGSILTKYDDATGKILWRVDTDAPDFQRWAAQYEIARTAVPRCERCNWEIVLPLGVAEITCPNCGWKYLQVVEDAS